MGTRSVHIVPCVNKMGVWKQSKHKWIIQYLQFDGHPHVQIERFLEDCKMLRMIKIGLVTSVIRDFELDSGTKEAFFEYLRAYYNYRSFDTNHSVGNVSFVDKYTKAQLRDNYWAEFSYEWWSDDHPLNSKSKSKKSMIYLTISALRAASEEKVTITFSLAQIINLCEKHNWDSTKVAEEISSDLYAMVNE